MGLAEMLSGFIPAGVGALLLILGLLGLFMPRVRNIWRIIPIGTPMVWSIVAIIIGFMVGGIGVIQGFIPTSTATTVNLDASGLPETSLSSCEYNSGETDTKGDGNGDGISIRSDPNSLNRVYLDTDESVWGVNATNQARTEFNVTFDCTRVGNIQEDGVVEIVVKGDEFKSETTTTDTSTYNILETSSVPSIVWTGKFQQTTRVADGDWAGDSSTLEHNYLTYAEGDKVLTLGIMGELDYTAFQNLENYTLKHITVYERSSSGDTPVAYISINKLP